MLESTRDAATEEKTAVITTTPGEPGELSPAARRHRDALGLPLSVLPLRVAGDALAQRSGRLAAAIRDGGTAACDALWEHREVAALRRLPSAELAAEWRSRLDGLAAWRPLLPVLRPDCDFAAVWDSLPAGDFGVAGRGVDYTAGIAAFHAARSPGSETLLHLLGAGAGGRFLDVLGGDGYVGRILRAAALVDGRANGSAARPEERALLATNDLTTHMFLQAGLWGFATREEASRLGRTFAAEAFDGVLFAYGTHHVDDLETAVEQAAGLVRPGGAVVLHDFLDEGPVGDWFHRVVHPFSKTGHDFPHIGPLRMAVALLLAGLRDVELYEMSDPFVVTAVDGRPARELILTYLAGMYGLKPELAADLNAVQSKVESTLTYPRLGDVPSFGADLAYVPRRAVVARARRPVGPRTPPSPADRRLLDVLRELLTAPPERFAAFGEAARWWFADQARWGVAETTRRSFLDRFDG